MENVKDLLGLLLHQVQMLYSAENQQVVALPGIIKKVHHNSLRNALNHHLGLTKEHKERLKKVPLLINKKLKAVKVSAEDTSIEPVTKNFDADYVCKGMKGLTDEIDELFNMGLSHDVTDAAIIGAVQKIEHYEICTYGTALAYAMQLHLRDVELLLHEILNEEYDADDLLTALATAGLNKEAEPEDMAAINKATDPSPKEAVEGALSNNSKETGKVQISERTINSPGGRAGTSHRRYPSGESRGH